MKLNHLNLCVDNLSEARDFFQSIFDFKLLDEKGEAIAVLSDDDGFTLILSSSRAFGSETPTYPKEFHVGFYVETPVEVDQFYEKLKAAHVSLESQPKKIRDGYTLYFTALGGILFEVTCFIR